MPSRRGILCLFPAFHRALGGPFLSDAHDRTLSIAGSLYALSDFYLRLIGLYYFVKKAPTRFELVIQVLQTFALPLGYGAI